MTTKNQRLNATITIGSVLEASVKRNVGFLKSGLNQVGNSIKEVERRQRELDRQRNVLKRQGKSVEALDREYEQLERTLNDLRRAQERWNRAAAASRRVGTSFNAMASEMARTVRLVTVGATLAGGAIFGLAASTASLGDDVAKTADKLNIGIEELQELRYAAERSGVSVAGFDKSLEVMTRNIGMALEGTGAQKDALDALGLSASELATMLPEEALGVIADRLQDVETQAEKAAIANDIFGRSGVGMLNMLRNGSRGLRDLRDDARRTGFVLSEQAARDAEVFQDTLLDTQLTLRGLKNTVGAELMPVVTGVMREIGDALVENREEVKRWAEGFADGVERALPVIGEVLTGLGKVANVVWDVTSATAQMVGGWENFGLIIGTVLASKTVLRVVQFGGAVFSLGRAMVSLAAATPLVVGGLRAIGLAMMANPLGLAVTAIAGGAILIYQNWDNLGQFFRQLFPGIGNAFNLAWLKLIKPVIDGLKATGGIAAAWEAVKAGLDSVLTWIGDKFRTVMIAIKPVIDALQWVQGTGAAVANGIGNALGIGGDGPELRTGPVARGDQRQRPQPQANALGGPFRPGWHLTGELGPELKFENRSGYVANNRAMRQLAGYASRIGSMFGQGRAQIGPDTASAARVAAMFGQRGSRPMPAASAGQQVVQHITNHINAASANANELLRLLQAQNRRAGNNGLHDRAPASGPFGR